jgi:UDP-N-acetylglucosamine 4-epimerase
MTTYDKLQSQLKDDPKLWLVTGVAGFIGSNLLETLLKLDQRVIGLDNFLTGRRQNLEAVRSLVSDKQWANFTFIEGDIRDVKVCRRACRGIDFVLHQAALGSVPRSIQDPITTHECNVNGTLNMLMAVSEHRVKRFVYASSSAVYGDDPHLPKHEDVLGQPLSPYAVSKRANELCTHAFAASYGLQSIGLRYFNVFGPRQDPEGAYAAVIPRWSAALIREQPIHVYGDGETSRDFCYIANVVQANLLAATTTNTAAVNSVYNVAVEARTTLNELYGILRELLLPDHPQLANHKPVYQDFRPGDVRHSQADISRAKDLLGYAPTHTLRQGLVEALDWYKKH